MNASLLFFIVKSSRDINHNQWIHFFYWYNLMLTNYIPMKNEQPNDLHPKWRIVEGKEEVTNNVKPFVQRKNLKYHKSTIKNVIVFSTSYYIQTRAKISQSTCWLMSAWYLQGSAKISQATCWLISGYYLERSAKISYTTCWLISSYYLRRSANIS